MSSSSFPAWLAAQAAQREERGLTRRLAESDRGEPLLDLAGNDYLGLARDPRVVAGAVAAAQAYGAGASASRLVSGTLSIHTELEQAMAAFTGFASALVFSTGYHANLSVVQALADRDTLVVSDAHIHASMIDACRLARATVTVTPHNDVAAVARALAGRTQRRALVLAETIYSVLGDAAPVAELAELAAAHDAVLIADEAHALGVAGPGGRGLLAAHGLTGRPDVVGDRDAVEVVRRPGRPGAGLPAVREHLVNRARPFIYDTGLAPAAAGGALAALRVVQAAPELPGRVRANAAILADACGVGAPAGAVLSVPMPGPREALAAVADRRRARPADRLLPPALHPRRHLPAPADRPRAPHRRRTRPGGQGAAPDRARDLPMTVCFVTGTDTGVGKTVVTAALAVILRARRNNVAVVKPCSGRILGRWFDLGL